MLEAFMLAVRQLPEPELRRPLILTLIWSVAVFVLVWIGATYEFARVEAAFGNYGALAAAGGIILLGAFTWLLFAAVENTILFCYSDRIVAAVEARHYRFLPTAGTAGWGDVMWSSGRLIVLTVLGNLVALPVYLIFPVMNLVLFLALNGYLLGRAYFDAVALRRMDDRAASLFWREHRGVFIINGAVSVALLTIPLVNLVVPVVGLAAAVHLLEGRRVAA